jgi:predicted alpha/beta-fold hydrolase
VDVPAFRPRSPWWGADLQTLRDTLRPPRFPADQGAPERIPIGPGEQLLALLDCPGAVEPLALVVLLHGLGGSSQSTGVRRLGLALLAAGFAVLRLNLRGAGAGRSLAGGSYAAHCNRDLAPALRRARSLAGSGPLFGVGFSLGGTVLLNGVLGAPLGERLLDGLVAISSPLDLAACSAAIGRPRNRLYERWLLGGLRRQTLADPGGLAQAERRALVGPGRVRTIRGFDALITAPRWGFGSVEDYYDRASPLPRLNEPAASLPPSLLIQALDDPWVPPAPAVALAGLRAGAREPHKFDVVLSPGGGHNGFHAAGGSWSDQLTEQWLRHRLGLRPVQTVSA